MRGVQGGFFLEKKPLELVLPVYSNSETAINAKDLIASTAAWTFGFTPFFCEETGTGNGSFGGMCKADLHAPGDCCIVLNRTRFSGFEQPRLQLDSRNLRPKALGRRGYSQTERPLILNAGTAMEFHLRLTGEFATLRHSSGWAKGEFSSWQKRTRFIIWVGFWQDSAWAR
jgi:hypothetical protein